MSKSFNLKRAFSWGFMGVLALMAIAAFIYRDDILFKGLDPKVPFQIYNPPVSPDYSAPSAWALLPGPVTASDPPADVFCVHPTAYDGGRRGNAAPGPMGRRGGRAGPSLRRRRRCRRGRARRREV